MTGTVAYVLAKKMIENLDSSEIEDITIDEDNNLQFHMADGSIKTVTLPPQ